MSSIWKSLHEMNTKIFKLCDEVLKLTRDQNHLVQEMRKIHEMIRKIELLCEDESRPLDRKNYGPFQ